MPSPDEQEYFVKSERCDFHGWAIKAIANIGNTGKHQLFFVTFVAKYHGLSRLGAEILSSYGFGTKRIQYATLVQETVATAREETRFVT